MKWTELYINRRECLEGLAALAAPLEFGRGQEQKNEASKKYTLLNADLEFSLETRQGRVSSRRLRNKLANETVELPPTDFAFEFDAGARADSSQFSASAVQNNAGSLDILYSGGTEGVEDLEVRVEYSLAPSQRYLRKQLSLRQTSQGIPRKLMRADLDTWLGVKRDWKSATADRMGCGSHPIACDTMWAGVEFVAAFNEYSTEGFVLRSRPGGKTLTSGWMKLHSTVAGAAEPGRVKEAFLSYIDDVRLAPPRLVAGYNTWWTLPPIFNEKELLDLVKALAEGLHAKHGVFFDFVTADAGWSDPHSIWKVNLRDFPSGMGNAAAAIQAAGGQLGLWMSPSEIYKDVIDWDWAEKNGYVVVPPIRDFFDSRAQGISVADPKYLDAAKEQLRQLIKEYRLGQVKYDGFVGRETRGHDGLLPGEDSVEPLAEASLELLQASKQADPHVYTEPTYLNSWYTYISPWMIKYADSVWANAGGDCPAGVGPAPDYRESQTTAREYFIFSSLQEVWLPQNALQYFDVVHCDQAGGFPNHAAMAFGRGRFFVSTYINPKFMTEADWGIYAGMLKWARSNEELLQNTVVLTSRVELGEPYAYAHWSGARGIAAVRNPSNNSQKFTLDMAKAGAPKGLVDAVCYAQYPYRQGIAEGVGSTSSIKLDLAPWELVFLEIVPRSELREPVAMGARWFRDVSGNMRVASTGAESVRVLLPHQGEQVVATRPVTTGNLRAEVTSQKVDRLPPASELRQGDKSLPSAAFELETEITIPKEAQMGQALLLLEFPGKVHFPSQCTCTVDGRTVPLRQSSSAGHIGSNELKPQSPWRDLLPYMSHWTWYVADLHPGPATIKFSGVLPHEKCRMGLWAWADWDLTQNGASVAIECPEPAMPQLQANLKRRGICVMSPGIAHEAPPSVKAWRAA